MTSENEQGRFDVPSIKFGLNTCFAVKRWPEPAEWTRIVKELGVADVQFSFDLADPVLVADASIYRETRKACDRHEIRITSAFTGLISYSQNALGHPNELMRRRAEEWFEVAIEATALLGGRGVGGHIAALSVSQFGDLEERERAIGRVLAAVRRLSQRAQRAGLGYLLWEVMPVAREYPADLDSAEELMTSLENDTEVPVALCTDLGHACAVGASADDRDPYIWLERLGRFTQVVHLQQTDGAGDRHWPFTAELNERGIVDPGRVVELVAKFRREEVELMLEPMFAFEAPDEQVVADLHESVAYWLPAVQKLGV